MRVASLRGADLVGPMWYGKQFSARVFFAVLLGLLCAAPSRFSAQTSTEDVHIQPRIQPPAPKEPEIDPALKTHTKPFKVDVDMVLVPVTITDPLNRLVTGLDRENFNLFEGKEQQEIKTFSSEDAPVSIGVIFDMSGSMSSKIERAREAVVEFFKTANPQDEFFMIAFADTPEEIADFTSSVDDIQGRLALHRSQGPHRAAGRHLPRRQQNAPGQVSEEGFADHLRRRRQP